MARIVDELQNIADKLDNQNIVVKMTAPSLQCHMKLP
jgi:hypothetical protein